MARYGNPPQTPGSAPCTAEILNHSRLLHRASSPPLLGALIAGRTRKGRWSIRQSRLTTQAQPPLSSTLAQCISLTTRRPAGTKLRRVRPHRHHGAATAAAPGTVAGDQFEPNRTGLGGPNRLRLGGCRRGQLRVVSFDGLRPGFDRDVAAAHAGRFPSRAKTRRAASAPAPPSVVGPTKFRHRCTAVAARRSPSAAGRPSESPAVVPHGRG